MSYLERKFATYCNKYLIQYIKEYSIPELPFRKFDFYLPKYKVLVELDGRQHFEFVEVFHGCYKSLKKSKDVDALKTWVGVKAGYRVIRIDHTKSEVFESFMYKALRSRRERCYSTPKMYGYLFRKIPKKYQEETSLDISKFF